MELSRQREYADWSVGWTKNPAERPAKMVPAQVPGAVQLDWARHENYPDYTFADNYKQFRWTEDVYWMYSCRLSHITGQIADLDDHRVFFTSKGIDYKFMIQIDGTTLHEQEGMFTPIELDVTDLICNADILDVLIFPVPKREGAPEGRWQADQSCKPAVSYGWDWHPRLVPSGIWDETFFEIRPALRITSGFLTYALSTGLDSAECAVEAAFSVPGGSCEISLEDPAGNVIFQKRRRNTGSLREVFRVTAPELWWPAGHGPQVLYRWKLCLRDDDETILDTREGRTGFRKTTLGMHPGAWDEPAGFPKSRSNPPVQLEINNRPVFCKGANWVNPDIFPGVLDEDRYRVLVELGSGANFNMFRVWGGGIINKECFYKLCDEAGIMVWQEFPLACNNYKGTPGYLDTLAAEGSSIVKRLREHPCVVLWCGGNELFNGWSGMTEQSKALRLLNALCYEHDPDTPFLMTSPLSGMAHGYYNFDYKDGKDVFAAMIAASNTAYTEFGCPGPSAAGSIAAFVPGDELFPPRDTPAWRAHHGFGAWPVSGNDTWFTLGLIKKYFGKQHSLEDLVVKGQLLQSCGYKSMYEEARRQAPRCSMALNWCYNEPWPTAANNSILNYPAEPKPAYFAVKDACRPVLLSLRIPKFSWKSGELLQLELWLLNDSPHPVPEGKAVCTFSLRGDETKLLEWEYSMVPPGTNQLGPAVNFPLPSVEQTVVLEIYLLNYKNKSIDSNYKILLNPSSDKTENQYRDLNA